jgi:hypothetical protein
VAQEVERLPSQAQGPEFKLQFAKINVFVVLIFPPVKLLCVNLYFLLLHHKLPQPWPLHTVLIEHLFLWLRTLHDFGVLLLGLEAVPEVSAGGVSQQ